jgi:hypothetical protein
MHPPPGIAVRHLLVENPAACRHPLYIAGPERPCVAKAVAMVNGPGKDVRNCLNPSMRMPWKTREVIFRILIPEIVEQQERIEIARLSEPESPAQFDAGSFGYR